LQVSTGKPQTVVGRQCSQAESSMGAEVYVGREADVFWAEAFMLGEAGRHR
jgi:hypothetical protein